MASTAERLRLLRRAYRERGGRPGRGDVAYAIYLAALLVPIVAFPLVRTVVVALSEPEVLRALSSPGAPRVVGLVLGLSAAAGVWLGGLYGPVTLPPFLLTLLAGTDLPRSRALGRTFAGRAAVVVAVFAALAALPAGVLAAAGAGTPGQAVAFVAMCAGFAVPVSVAWLAGQACGPHPTRALGAGLAAASLGGWALPGLAAFWPWGWVAATWPARTPVPVQDPATPVSATKPPPVSTPPLAPTDLPASSSLPPVPAPSDAVHEALAHSPGLAALLLAVVVVACAACVGRLLNALRGERLVREGARWASFGTAAAAGDLSAALGGLRARPSVGRRWRAVRGRHPAGRFLVADLVGGARTPVRLLLGCAALVGAGALLALAPGLPVGAPGSFRVGWLVAAVGAGAGYLALGVFCDGLRQASACAVAPPLYAEGPPRLFAYHSSLPLAAGIVAGGLGLVAVAAPGIAGWGAAAGTGLTMVVLVALRAYDGAKGPLPVLLLTPIPSPMGDLSSAVVALWQADALLIALVGGAVLVTTASGDLPVAVGLAAGTVAALLVGLRRRLARL